MATTGTMAFCGDSICQQIEKNRPYSIKRSLKFGAYGLLMGPQVCLWYRVLCRNVTGGSFVGIKRMACDQLCFGPYDLAFALSFNALINGGDLNNIKYKIGCQWLDTYKTSLFYWPIVLTLNFTYVPIHYRVIFSNVAAMFFNGYVSYKAHQEII